VELPGTHPDGLDRVRARGRQRGGLQAERVHPGGRPLVRGPVRRGGAGAAGPADRLRRDADELGLLLGDEMPAWNRPATNVRSPLLPRIEHVV